MRITLSAIINECNAIRVTVSDSSSSVKPKDDEEGEFNDGRNYQQFQSLQTLQGKDVDEAISRERERDLRKINQDLAMVNEMFK